MATRFRLTGKGARLSHDAFLKGFKSPGEVYIVGAALGVGSALPSRIPMRRGQFQYLIDAAIQIQQVKYGKTVLNQGDDNGRVAKIACDALTRRAPWESGSGQPDLIRSVHRGPDEPRRVQPRRIKRHLTDLKHSSGELDGGHVTGGRHPASARTCRRRNRSNSSGGSTVCRSTHSTRRRTVCSRARPERDRRSSAWYSTFSKSCAKCGSPSMS